MRTLLRGLSVSAALLVLSSVVGATASPALAAEPTGSICASNAGTIKMSPGLEETEAKVQNITIKGVLSGCSGSTVTEAKYVAHLKSAGPMTCATLAAGEAATGTILLKWTPKKPGGGTSHSTTEMVLTSESSTMYGSIEAGPFAGDGLYSPISASFGSCGDKKAKLKTGSLAGSSARVAAPPKADVESPEGGGVYTLGQVVPTTFSCSEGVFGPGLESCTDSNGASGGAGTLDTSELGEHDYVVIARSVDGLKDRASIHYEVVE